MTSYHEILGIEENASKQRIIQAYREKSALHHPDKGGNQEMMKLINQAREELLKYIDDAEYVGTAITDLDEILKSKVFDHIDHADERLSTRFRETHRYCVNKNKTEEIINLSGYTYFKEFATDLYFDITLSDGEVLIVNYNNLFEFIEKHRLLKGFNKLAELSLPVTPHNAVKLFILFIEGKCLGNNLTAAKEWFSAAVQQTSSMHPVYKLYSGMLGILNIEQITPEQGSKLLEHIDQITDYVRSDTKGSMSYMALLLQSKFFRALFSQALHFFWKEHNVGFKEITRAKFNNINMTKSYFGVLAKQVIEKERNGEEDHDLLTAAAYIKKLHEFERFTSEAVEELHTSDFYRERGFTTLDWLTVLIPFASRSVIVNVLMQAGTYFQQAAASSQQDLAIAKADEQLALHAYMQAITISSKSAPDLEIYTHINCLKFIAACKYQNEDLKELVEAIQTRTLLLADLFPVYVKLQANIDFLKNQNQTLWLLRRLLYILVDVIWQNNTREGHEQYIIDHDYVNVLYQAYEGCLKNWFEEVYNPELENRFRLELMELLLKRNGWKFNDLDQHLITSSSLEHDPQGWMQLTQKPLKIAWYGAKDHFCSLEGFEVNHKTGFVNFIFSDYPNGADRIDDNSLTLYDLTEMLAFNVSVAHFSLDPVDPQMMYHPFNVIRFAPKSIYRSQFLNTMLLSDYILKFLTIGQEVQARYPYNMRNIEAAISDLPAHLKKIIYDFHKAKQYNNGSIHRFWLEAEQVAKASLVDDANGILKVAVADLKMVVKKHTMERDHNGNLVDTQKDHEGWKIYIFTEEQKRDFDRNPKIITGPAIIFVLAQRTAFFIAKQGIYKEEPMPQKHVEQLEKLATYEREADNQVKLTIDNSMLIYDFIKDFVEEWAEEPTYFSPEHVFAQEFTKHYDEFSEYILEFARLRELSKITVVIRILNSYKTAEEEKVTNLQKLLNELPGWFEKYEHPCNHGNYFALPDEASSLTAEEKDFAVFKHKNIDFIKKILPKNIYVKSLAHLREVCQIITADSEEVNSICNDLYNKNANEITRRQGSHAWRINSNKVWDQICAKKPEYAEQLTVSKKKQLQQLFQKQTLGVSAIQLQTLINNAMAGQPEELAEELGQWEFIEAKKQLQTMIDDSKKLLIGLQTIGLGKNDRTADVELELEKACLWVPASVHHHVEGNSSCFVYGGVRVMPKINSIERTNQNFNRLIGNAFNGPGGRTTVTSDQINRSSVIGPPQIAKSFQVTATNAGNVPTRTQANLNANATVNTNRGVFANQSQAATTSTYRSSQSSVGSYNSTSLPIRTQTTSSNYNQQSVNSSNTTRAPATAYSNTQASASKCEGSRQSSGNTNNSSGTGRNPGGVGGSSSGGNHGSDGSKYSNNSDFKDGLKLRTELAFKEAGLLNGSGKLTEKALECTKNPYNRLKEGCDLKNKEVIAALTKNGQSIADWAKYSTNNVTLGTGNVASIHFYYNEKTGEVMYDHDFKVKGGFAVATNTTQHKNCNEYVNTSKYGGDDVTLFTNAKTLRKNGQEPVSQPDPCHRYDGPKKLNP